MQIEPYNSKATTCLDLHKLISSSLLIKYPTLFNYFLTTIYVIEHDIDVGSHSPVKQNVYHVNPVKRELVKQDTQYLLEHKEVIPSASPWCSPCLLVSKLDGTQRF